MKLLIGQQMVMPALESVRLGDLSLRCGGRVEAHRPQWGLEGVYDITAHEHRWEKGVFTTSLSLEGIEA